ncbi:MAG: hypothetical protein ACM3JQ_01850 [Candidatus Eiseniibacteriota bacterium]
MKIDSALSEYYSVKAIDPFNDSREIDSIQRKELIETTIKDNMD